MSTPIPGSPSHPPAADPARHAPPSQPDGPIDAAALAKERGRGVVSLELAWQVALEALLSAGASRHQIELLLGACPSPAVALRVAHLLAADAPCPKNPGRPCGLDAVAAEANRSNTPLAGWFAALAALVAWLEEHSRKTNLQTALGYLTCAQAAIDAGQSSGTLAQVVRHFLESKGYDG